MNTLRNGTPAVGAPGSIARAQSEKEDVIVTNCGTFSDKPSIARYIASLIHEDLVVRESDWAKARLDESLSTAEVLDYANDVAFVLRAQTAFNKLRGPL
jgi:hypothetical protein